MKRLEDIDEDRVLPRGELRGQLLICEGAWRQAQRLLPTFRGPDGDHEGMVFLFGRLLDADTAIVTTALAPNADHGPGHVICTEQAVLAASRAGRAAGVVLVAQLHSHPRGRTEHSPGDDHLIVMPFDRMISIVAPHYGRTGLEPVHSLGVHQFQGGQWVLASPASVRARVRLLPDGMDLR
jgi:hypothetical protein